MIKCMDNQVVPAELEDLISRSCPGVAEVSVVGMPHPEYGEVAAAFVILHEAYKGKVSGEDIKKIVSGEFLVQQSLVYIVHGNPLVHCLYSHVINTNALNGKKVARRLCWHCLGALKFLTSPLSSP
ncbi:hypothetical protein V5799_001390 [Amblyomma americanum]|uniref:AMP-binding enzyme C-terminal domain-containing protein n=1 Tax=Amblyomma americanum TaxID=6943 RepID=A0AAQ4D0B9_AMBAM